MAKTKPTPEPISQDQAEKIMSQYATASSKLKSIEAEIELKCQEIRIAYADQTEMLKSQQTEAFEKLEQYCESNPELFQDKRSVELLNGKMGYQTGQPKLVTMKGFKWDGVLTLMKSKLKDFIRTTDSIDKASLLLNREDKAIVKKMNACGVEVVQEEIFYIESYEEKLQTA